MGVPERKSALPSERLNSYRTDRRTALGASAAAILSAAGMMAVGKPVFAQDATPAAEQVGNDPVATPEAGLPTIPPEIEEFANDWPMWQHDYGSTRHAVGASVDSSNVSELGVAWELPLDAGSGFGAITSNPIVQGERVYLIDNEGNIQALDRESGEVIWRVDNNVATFGSNGVAVGYGILIGVLGDTAEVLALDAESGEELWRFQISNHAALGITTSPVIYDGYVLVSTEPGGNSKGTYLPGAAGELYCLDVQTGITRWKWSSVEDDLWGNFAINSGGGIWYPATIDVDTGVIYVGVGNAAPVRDDEFPNAASRPGVNLYAGSLVAIDPNQGKVLWHISVKPRDIYNHDNQLSPVLGVVNIGGADADVVYTSGKHGYVVAAHRDSGHEFWRRSVGIHLNDGLAELPAEELIEVFPGSLGGVQSPMAFANGVLYVPAFNMSNTMNATSSNYDHSALSRATANLVALDGATGDVIWDTEIGSGIAGPGPVVANDVVFIGTLDGIVRAYNIEDGSEVWRSQTSAGLNAPFAVAGDMLLVPAGSFIAASSDTPDPLPGVRTALIAYQLGATGEVTMGEAAGESSPVAEDTDTLVNVVGVDIAFEQTELTIAADTDVTVVFTNNGVLQHDWVVEGTDFGTDIIDGGTSQEVVVNLPAGEYVYFCTVQGHREAGMQGTLIVG